MKQEIITLTEEGSTFETRNSKLETPFEQFSSSNIYQSITLQCVGRLLSLLDRNPYSKTYGSFSRNYWHYKTLTDFPSASDQQGVLALVCIYLINPNPKLLELIEAGIFYWTKIQNKDGSFNEWYPNEHSHVATAFTSYAISESLFLLKDKISKNTLDRALASLKKSGAWLKKNIDTIVLNHTTGAVAALYNIFLLTGENIFLEACKENLNTLIRLQDPEGWFPEYKGADPGYLGVSIDYLAKYWSKSKDLIAENSLKKALDFLIWFYLEGSKTTGGEFGSRNIKYILPHGLLLLSKQFDSANYLESNLRAALQGDKVISPNTVDDRYFLFFHLPNYAQASLYGLEENNFKDIRPKTFLKIFPSGGLISCKQENYHLITNFKKGGVSVIDSRDSILNDSGYFAKVKGQNKVLTSQTKSNLDEMSTSNELPLKLSLSTEFIEVNNSEPIIKKMLIPFRIFNYTFGQSSLFMSFFNKLIKKLLINQTKKSKIKLFLERSFLIEENKVTIEDKITTKDKNLKLEKLSIEPAISVMHVPSSKFFCAGDLSVDESFNLTNPPETFNEKGEINTIRTLYLG